MTYDKEYIEKRLRKHTVVDEATGCWLWTGCVGKGGKSEGYGRINIYKMTYYVHRLSAHIYHGISIEKKSGGNYEQALHSCPNKNCWNPEHLHVGTHWDNMRERDSN